MHPEERPKVNVLEQIEFDRYMKKREIAKNKYRGKTAEANYEEIYSDYPEAKDMVNIKQLRLKKTYLYSQKIKH